MKALMQFFQDNDWEIPHIFEIEERPGRYKAYDSLELSEASQAVLSSLEKGIYEHQWIAMNEFMKGANVCISTSTSSGKTLIFHICGLEILSKNPDAKILAIYPLKALGTEQELRWQEVIAGSGLFSQFDLEFLERLYTAIATQIGASSRASDEASAGVLNLRKLKQVLQATVPEIRETLHLLEGAGLLRSFDLPQEMEIRLPKKAALIRAQAAKDRELYRFIGKIRLKPGEQALFATKDIAAAMNWPLCETEERLRTWQASGALTMQPSKRGLAVHLPRRPTDFHKRLAQQCQHSISLRQNSLIGRIDGSVPQGEREKIIKDASIIIMTPDVIHAWLLSNVSKPSIQAFLQTVELLVIDEAHTYSGVFGSNSAFLYRRLQHLISIAGGSYQIIAASATIKEPRRHLEKLTGVEFTVVDHTHETSPKKKMNIVLVDPPQTTDLLTSLSNVMRFLIQDTEYQFITFVDSRKQTEYIASIASRNNARESEVESDLANDLTKTLPVYPYRAGYEEEDRNRIQGKLSTGDIRGVISTSALEMGIDIPHLNLGILVGVPNSGTSYYQRIGRIGRQQDGIILIVNNGSIQTASIFREPERLQEIPLSESTLYLENPRIQYIHTLCLARQGGEDESVRTIFDVDREEFMPEANFPETFINLCHSERIGEISAEFQTMKMQAGESPNHAYPLRDIDVQYRVAYRKGPHARALGSLRFDQVMREAYPGAIYYYQTETFRVGRIKRNERVIEVRREKRYTTKPTMLPRLIFPNLSEGNVLQSKKFGELTIVECNLQIRESIIGFTEKRGPQEFSVSYPLDTSLGFYFDTQRFTRFYFTSGVIIDHPSLHQGVNCPLLAEILYEAFFMVIPFERQDIHYGSDKHRAEREGFHKEGKFISIFDQTYGSLRLTRRFLDQHVIEKVFAYALDIAENDPRYTPYQEEIDVLKCIKMDVKNPAEKLVITNEDTLPVDENLTRVILPDSVGLNIKKDNEEFLIEGIFYHPKNGLYYRGRHLSQTSKRWTGKTEQGRPPVITVPISNLREIPGESKMGFYNYETGEVETA